MPRWSRCAVSNTICSFSVVPSIFARTFHVFVVFQGLISACNANVVLCGSAHSWSKASCFAITSIARRLGSSLPMIGGICGGSLASMSNMRCGYADEAMITMAALLFRYGSSILRVSSVLVPALSLTSKAAPSATSIFAAFSSFRSIFCSSADHELARGLPSQFVCRASALVAGERLRPWFRR